MGVVWVRQAVSNDNTEKMLPLGAVLSQLPVDMSIGKMLVLASLFAVTHHLATIAAALSVQVP